MHFFFIKILPNMSEQEKKRQRIYDLHNAETSFFVYRIQSKEKKSQKKSFFNEKGEWMIVQKNEKKAF